MASLDTLSLNETLALLTHPYRRYVLYYLTEVSEEVNIATLAAAIAEWSGDHTGTDRSDDNKTVEIGLRHSHLPKLAGAGIITFGENKGSIVLRDMDGLDRFLVETAQIDGYAPVSTAD